MRLRKKLLTDPAKTSCIKTIHGIGYSFTAAVEIIKS
jgi:DNA-binding response OmpR family regulator